MSIADRIQELLTVLKDIEKCKLSLRRDLHNYEDCKQALKINKLTLKRRRADYDEKNLRSKIQELYHEHR